MEEKTFKTDLGGKELKVIARDLAENANGNILVQYEDTLLLATCVMAKEESSNVNFFPLSVNYEEKYYAAGKIRGARYIRREGRPSDEAVLNSRLIDRAIRPRFPKNLNREIQIIVTCLSWDGKNDPAPLGLLAASIALSISDIPWHGPIGTVIIGKTNGELILNPMYEQKEESDLSLTVAGIEEEGKVLINMVESNSKEIDEETVIKSLELAESHIKKLIDFQKEIAGEIGKEKFTIDEFKNGKLEKNIKEWIGNKIDNVLKQPDKDQNEKLSDLRRDFSNYLKENYAEPNEIRFGFNFFDEEVDRIVHEIVLTKEIRIDGRGLDQIREIKAEVGLIPRSHGSGLFSRGKTKSLSILTLGTPGDHQILEGMEIVGKKRFMHHYNFPPYSTGETRPIRGPGRREIGHGILAEKTLRPIVPVFDDFPYTTRIVSEMLSSNGSTSMASVCSSSLALMDAGIPIQRPAAGIAIGLITDKEGNYRILTDIQGPEDHHGDMDLKIAGTEKGINALQMDVKISGVTINIFSEALKKGKEARLKILDKMKEAISGPRENLSPWAPRVYLLQIDPEKIGDVIGPGGKTIRKITDNYEVEIDIEESGKVFVSSEKEENAKKAISFVKNITKEIKAGEIFEGKVKKVQDIGVFVEVLPGKEGLVRLPRFKKTDLKPGSKVLVRVDEIDSQGRINLSFAKTSE
jgi:polyribonucleotide nucleotidyltransferase